MSAPTMDWTKQGGPGPAAYQGFLVPALFTPFAEQLVDGAARVGPGDDVVDVACGTGCVSRIAAARSGVGGTVTGVDIAPPMLDVARAQSAPADAAPITYLEGPAEALPLAEGVADVVTCHHGLQFFPDRVGALREMRRVLRPGGRLAVGCWTDLPGSPTFAVLLDALVRHLGEEKGGMMRAPFGLPDAGEMRRLLDEAGFSDIETEVVERPTVYPAFDDLATRALSAGPLWPLYAESPAEVRAAIDEDVRRGLAHLRDDAGHVATTSRSLVGTATA